MLKLRNPHPGRILLEFFLRPFDISQNELARDLGISPRRVNEIVLGKRGISAETAILLCRVLGSSERFWLGLQADYDLEAARARMAARQSSR